MNPVHIMYICLFLLLPNSSTRVPLSTSGASMSTQLLINVKYDLCALKGFLTWPRGWLHVLHPQKEPQTLGDMLSVSNIWTLFYKYLRGIRIKVSILLNPSSFCRTPSLVSLKGTSTKTPFLVQYGSYINIILR